MSIFKDYPETKELLLQLYKDAGTEKFLVNGHIHTPYSFSAFESIEQALQMAKKENVKVMGINDFNTGAGYPEFTEKALDYSVFPLFNIEFIGLDADFQEEGVRVNDPNNPGRIYFSGKGLSVPFSVPPENQKLLDTVLEESQNQVREMIVKTNEHLLEFALDFELDYDEIREKYAPFQVRERHIAKALAEKVNEKAKGNIQQAEKVYTKLFVNVAPDADLNDRVAIENEIRTRFLKKGGFAFVPEDDAAFMTLNQIIELILDAGGIPCYPVLLDDKNGNFTDFESDWNKMHAFFQKLNIGCIELIPNRNTLEVLEKFVKFFDEKGYIICFGTEHNNPDLFPVTPQCSGNKPMSDYLLEISMKSASVLAAHQYLMETGKEGYLNENHSCKVREIEDFITLGYSVIKYFGE